MRISIETCPRCGNRHDHIEATAIKVEKTIESRQSTQPDVVKRETYYDWDFEYVCPVRNETIRLNALIKES